MRANKYCSKLLKHDHFAFFFSMQAVYLQSVRSPIKKTVKVGENQDVSGNRLDRTFSDYSSVSFKLENTLLCIHLHLY